MLIFRPVRFADLPQIEQMAISAGDRLTTLPNNRDHLAQLINNTQRSLQGKSKPKTDQSYHFVLEDTDTQEIIGISGIEACVGDNIPFYNYRCDEIQHYSQELQLTNTVDTLSLSQDSEGASRLYTFLLAQPNVANYALSLLSLSRLMFIAQRLEHFSERLIVELQGVVNQKNQSPFWQALGQHFFNMDFHRANYLTGINAKGFIADLMPKNPIYVPLLAQSAQQAIGCVRPDMQAVETLLRAQGFNNSGYISIFDGGPTLEATTSQLATIQQLTSCTLQAAPSQNAGAAKEALVCNNTNNEFRAIYAQVNLDCLYLDDAQAKELNVTSGDTVHVLPLAN